MMDRERLDKHINEVYSCSADYPWLQYPKHAVYRHRSNRKWFGVVMELPKSKLGLETDEAVDVLNVKCEPFLISSYLKESGFFPAYHMNKKHWITIALDGSVDDDTVLFLLEMSYDVTAKKR